MNRGERRNEMEDNQKINYGGRIQKIIIKAPLIEKTFSSMWLEGKDFTSEEKICRLHNVSPKDFYDENSTSKIVKTFNWSNIEELLPYIKIMKCRTVLTNGAHGLKLFIEDWSAKYEIERRFGQIEATYTDKYVPKKISLNELLKFPPERVIEYICCQEPKFKTGQELVDYYRLIRDLSYYCEDKPLLDYWRKKLRSLVPPMD